MSDLSQKSIFEHASKFGAGLVAAVYVTGFMVISMHHATIGVSQMDFLKPRIFAAGAVFLLFVVVPVLAAARMFGFGGLRRTFGTPLEINNPDDAWVVYPILGIAFYAPAFGLAWFTSVLFFRYHAPSPEAPWLYLAECLVLGVGSRVVRREITDKPSRCFLFTALVVVALGITALKGYGETFFFLTIWFFFVGIIGVLLLKIVSNDRDRKALEWENYVFFALAVVFIFSVFIYGQIKSSLGGGLPTSVLMKLSAGVLGNSDTTKALLIEETDSGFYLILPDKPKECVYIPRGSVAAVYYPERSRVFDAIVNSN